MDRVVALALLTVAFVPAAVLGALPVVAPVVVALAVILRLLVREPR